MDLPLDGSPVTQMLDYLFPMDKSELARRAADPRSSRASRGLAQVLLGALASISADDLELIGTSHELNKACSVRCTWLNKAHRLAGKINNQEVEFVLELLALILLHSLNIWALQVHGVNALELGLNFSPLRFSMFLHELETDGLL